MGFLPYASRNMMSSSNLKKGSVLVMLGQSFTVQPRFAKYFALDFPMELESRLVAVSKSTIVRRVSLSEVKTKSVLVSSLQKLVHMDVVTKKSCPLTPRILDMCRGIESTDDDDTFRSITAQQPPSRSFTSTQMIKHSDMDCLMHTNQGAYLRFAFDSLAEATSQNAFSVIMRDVCNYQALSANALHMTESFAGDLLDIKVWDDETDPYVLHCAMSKNKANVYYVNIKLTENVNNSAYSI